jgi:NTE family protein
LAAFTAGDAGLAVQASCAIEGQFTPVRIRGDQYVDPDLFQPLPVRLARSLGAKRVLSVDASAHEDKAPDLARQRYAASDLRKRRLTAPDASASDVHLHPEFGYWVSMTREFRERAIQAGYAATLAQASRIRALHANS